MSMVYKECKQIITVRSEEYEAAVDHALLSMREDTDLPETSGHILRRVHNEESITKYLRQQVIFLKKKKKKLENWRREKRIVECTCVWHCGSASVLRELTGGDRLTVVWNAASDTCLL